MRLLTENRFGIYSISMREATQRGSTLVNVIIIVIVFGIVIGGCFYLIGEERAKTRDAKRLSDISRIQAAFEILYNDTASYELAANGGCNQEGSPVSSCNLSAYLPTIADFKDPGSSRYLITEVPSETAFGVSFQLEKEYGTLIEGKHKLTPAGIK